MQLQKDEEKWKNAKLQVVGVSYDNVDHLKQFSQKRSIGFPLLSDKDSTVIKQLGLEFKNGISYPTTLLIDQSGIVRGELAKEGIKLRHTTDELLALASQLELTSKTAETNGSPEKKESTPGKEPAKAGSGG